jgi:hypothetical protein
MSIIDQLASVRGLRSDAPNKELAKIIARGKDKGAVKELVETLRHNDKEIQSDCIKVLYEIGYLDPDLIADYILDFMELLHHKNNRLIWGGMIAISTIADRKAKVVADCFDEIVAIMKAGSVITADAGIKALANAAAQDYKYSKKISPFLLKHLQTCRPKEIPQHAESIIVAVNAANKGAFENVLKKREKEMTGAQLIKIKKIYKNIKEI